MSLAEVCFNNANYDHALEYAEKALAINPENAELHNNLGLILHMTGRFEEAMMHFQKAIDVQPDQAEVYYNLGMVLKEKGRLNEAIANYEKAIHLSPSNADAYVNLGIVFREIGQIDEAIVNYRKALELNPKNIDTYVNLGIALREIGQLNEAIFCFQKALQIDADYVLALNNLGITVRERGNLDDSVAWFQKVISIDPKFDNAYFNLGIVFHEKRQLDKALDFFQKTIKLNPNSDDAYYNLGIVYGEKGQFHMAIDSYKKAINIKPTNSNALNNLGIVLQDKGQIDEAILCFRKALGFKPDDAEAHWNIAQALLLSGNFKEGWKEYEWRLKVKDFHSRTFSEPLWDGSDIAGLSILLHAEQGLGDTIQFIRYVPLVAKPDTTIIVSCQKELRSLLQNVKGVSTVVSYGEPLPQFDVHCPLLSLPLLFSTTLDNIPAKIPYISADTLLVQKWREKIQPDKSKVNIGIVWAGNPKFPNDVKRSCSYDIFLPLAGLSNVALYSLQKREVTCQAKNFPMGMQLIDYTGDIHDFSDTAGLIENLDVVISVDTAVAHLAGALGKPVWTLLPYSPDWRWMLNRNDSPWYPSMRLFRQPSRGDWRSVIEDVKTAVKDILKKKLKSEDLR
jgi:tetratricopeptide (TPR) repeat protein